MTTTLQIDRIAGLWLDTVSPGVTRASGGLTIPGGYAQAYTDGIDGEQLTINGTVAEANGALSRNKIRQLLELVENPGYPFSYIVFPGSESVFDGWYVLESLTLPRDRSKQLIWPYSLQVRRIASAGSHRLGTRWETAAETYTGWTAPIATPMVSLPYNATNIAWAVTATRTGSGGSNQILESPTRQVIHFKSAATLADWYAMECRIYDTMTAGDTTEANWVQVFSTRHVFAGDKVIQNGLLRLKISGTTETWYVYNTVAGANAWASIGTLRMLYSDSNDALHVHLEITELAADVVAWTEIRMYAERVTRVDYELRRGAYHCRVYVTAFADMNLDGAIFLDGTYTYLFNASQQGAAGVGSLTAHASSPYLCGFSAAQNTIAGFVLADKPTYQPFDAGTNALAMSNPLTSGTSRLFWLIGWPVATSGMANIGNPGFETAGAGGADVFGSWSEYAGDGAIANEGSLVHTGTHAAKLTAGAGVGTYINTIAFTVTPGSTISLSFWTRGDGTHQGRYQFYDVTHSTGMGSLTSTGVTGTTYTKVSATATVPTGCTAIAVLFFCPATNGGYCYFDDVLVMDLVTVRATAAQIAAHCLEHVRQEPCLIPAGYYV